MSEFTHLCKFLKQKLLDAQLTQSGLAEELGDVHNQCVSNWERGLCAPPSHCLETLIKVLKIKREEMVDVMVQDARLAIESKILRKKSNRKTRKGA